MEERELCPFSEGDKVRILRQKPEFSKGYARSWTKELYVIKRVLQSNGICFYRVTDLEGNNEQKLYKQQINLVLRNGETDVDRAP